MSAEPFDIRDAELTDVPEIARLLVQLGHPTEPASIVAKWEQWRATGDGALVAATAKGVLLGSVTMHTTIVLHRPKPIGRITALVVDERARGLGIGRALVAEAERRLALAGCGLIEVTSNLRRTDAHAFYEHLGYDRTSYRFFKSLESS
jgi:GNAT superfamily N-acetyltransferase